MTLLSLRDLYITRSQCEYHTGTAYAIPLRRLTSFCLLATSFSDVAMTSSNRFFSFCANAMYVERIFDPYNVSMGLLVL